MPETNHPAPKAVDLEAMYELLRQKVLDYNPNANFDRIRAAYQRALDSHAGQFRKDGSPYVSHAVSAAQIAADLGLDEDSIVAALLHDCVEDTSLTCEDIAKEFGPTVAEIVDGVTKLTRVQYTSKEDEQMENMRKMLMAMSRDIRVILIKIADRLHNMRTMEYQSPEKQRSKSLETMEIYAPIAHRLGMQRVKWELEDLSLQYLDPVGYKAITENLDRRRESLDQFMASMKERISQRLAEWGIQCTIYNRLKHVYSIYRKMYAQRLSLDGIFDLCAFRVIVDSIPDCYNVLGHIHDMFKPVPGRFKDYISTPKPNGYQSVHTTVIGPEGIPFEVQIRTWEMHRTAEYGVAAHWKYKSGQSGVREGDEEKFAWVRRLLETQQESDATDFFHELKIDMFADEVFVFTPQGDVINLPAGATPIDFAYSIHSAVGNRMVGAKVNGRIVPFSHLLQNGDIVEIQTSKAAPGPSRDWLTLCKSSTSRTKIKQWLKKEKREENILHGKAMFESELRRNNISMATVMSEEILPVLLKRVAVTSMDDLLAAIGYGGMTATRAVNRIKDEVQKAQRQEQQRTAVDRINEAGERRSQQEQRQQKAIHGVLVEGLDNCLVKFSRCCSPVPGDDIVGFITRGYGVSVHRKDCPNYRASLQKEEESGRWIPVTWAENITDSYVTTLFISSRERSGLVIDLATVLAGQNAKIRSLSARDTGDGSSTATVSLEVRSLAELQNIINKISAIHGVSAVTRFGG